MNEAIRLAIEKGGYYLVGASADGNHWSAYDNDIVLDPLFWQALGRALGWKDFEWSFNAQRFMKFRMENKDELYWKDILT